MSRRLIPISALVAVMAGCAPPAEEPASTEPEPTGTERPATLVETVIVESTEFVEQIELTGITEPLRSAEVRAQVGGRITDFDLVEGQTVQAGDTVMRLNTSQGRAAISRLEVERAQLESDIERTERLIRRGLATDAELERLRSQRDALGEGIDEIEVGLREARHRAPISGIVTHTFAEEGEFLGQGDPVARIVDISTITVQTGLPEREIAHVTEGQEVQIQIEALGQKVTGVIHRISVEANPRNRTFLVEIHVDNEAGGLRAGMRATVILTKAVYEEAVVIPRDAIIQTMAGSEVFLASDGVARSRAVELGPGLGRFVLVNGLTAGDELVVRGQRALVQEEPLEVTRSGACCNEQLHRYRFGDDVPVLTPEEPPSAAPEVTGADNLMNNPG